MVDVYVTITQRIIVKLLKVVNAGRFILNTQKNNYEADAIKISLFELSEDTCCSLDFGKVKNMKTVEVQAAKVITRLKSVERTFEA